MLRYKNPINYMGAKTKLLDKIMPLFPKNINNFFDVFGGGANVLVNVTAKKYVYNDINPYLVELIQTMYKTDYQTFINTVLDILKKYNLSIGKSKSRFSKINYDAYQILRSDYNKDPNPIHLFVLILYSFNSQINFNKKGEFNVAAGSKDFCETTHKNLKNFMFGLHNKEIEFQNKSYNELEIPDDSFVYLDPPYLITGANYNKSWNENTEKDFLEWVDTLNSRNIKFALNNVIEHKNRKNDILIEFMKKYNVTYLTKDYNTIAMNKKNKMKTQEVFVTNYEPSITDW